MKFSQDIVKIGGHHLPNTKYLSCSNESEKNWWQNWFMVPLEIKSVASKMKITSSHVNMLETGPIYGLSTNRALGKHNWTKYWWTCMHICYKQLHGLWIGKDMKTRWNDEGLMGNYMKCMRNAKSLCLPPTKITFDLFLLKLIITHNK